jgi:hypothetical protein
MPMSCFETANGTLGFDKRRRWSSLRLNMPATGFNWQPAHLVGPLVPGILFGFHKPHAQTKPSSFWLHWTCIPSAWCVDAMNLYPSDASHVGSWRFRTAMVATLLCCTLMLRECHGAVQLNAPATSHLSLGWAELTGSMGLMARSSHGKC